MPEEKRPHGPSLSDVEQTLNEPRSDDGTPLPPMAPTAGRTTVPVGEAAPVGDRLGRYRILKKLGQGGMGSVFLAHDEELDRQVALKVPHLPLGDAGALERFLREARAAATLSHPNLCPVYDFGRESATPFLAMAYVEGEPLSETLRRGPLPPAEAAELVRRVAVAVEEAHARGVIHRDLKPSNIMLTPRGEPVVMDFGLARRSSAGDSRLTHSGMVLGTPAYMPPEQAEGDTATIGPRSDVYSLGAILYECFTGRPPFEGSVGQVLAQVLTRQPPAPSSLRPGLDPCLEAVCLKALAKKPADRYASMRDFADALSGWLAARPGGDPRRSRWPWLAAGLAVVAAAFLGFFFLNTRQGKVRIEVNDRNAVVLIDGEQVRIEKLGEPIVLKPGKHGLVVKRGDVVVETRDFAVVRGDNPALKITLEPLAPPKRTPARAGGVFALLVGVDHYDNKKIGDLKYADGDAAGLAQVLRAHARRLDDVVQLTTSAAKPHLTPRRHNVRRELKKLAGACTEADTLVVAFCGKEVLPRGNPAYFLGLADADPADPSSLLSLAEVYAEVARSKAGFRLVLIDACRMPPQGDDTPHPVAPPPGVTAFFGSSDREICFEDADHKHGVFSYYLIEGLRGDADLNRDGKVMLSELERFVKEGVPEHVRRKHKQKQDPELFGRPREDRALVVVKEPPAPGGDGEPAGFCPLFNGKDLSGWTVDSGAADSWEVKDGALIVRGAPEDVGWLMTTRSYADFVLRLEYKYDAGANSGITFRAAPGEGRPRGPMLLEIQLLDDSHPNYANVKLLQKTGSLFTLALDRPAKLKPRGEWNALELEARSAMLGVKVNGAQVLQTDLGNFADLADRYAALKRSSGRIGLQNWRGGTMWFRKIEVKELRAR